MQCDFFGCSREAMADFPIIDEEGEDQGTENLCSKHAPYSSKPFSNTLPDTIDEWMAGIKKTPVSGLVEVTDPTNFEQVQRLVLQTESLNQIQENIRSHRSI